MQLRLITAWIGLALAVSAVAAPKSMPDYAVEFRGQLTEKILPYWYDTAQDKKNGGYLLSDGPSKTQAKEKQLVSQARMLWTFSHAHRLGYSDKTRNYLKAADQGYRFLLTQFLDKERGGYYWKTDLTGRVTNTRKIVYGQSFVIYALVEYARASGRPEPLTHALNLFYALENHARDKRHKGWTEHFTHDWEPLSPKDPHAEVEVAGYKSANTHLHLMEALTELYTETRSRNVRKALSEALDLNMEYFYPQKAGLSCFHRQPNWKPVTDPASAGLSYGHNVEFAWLMIEAQKALGKKPSWSHFEAHLDHALKYGFDHQRGGLMNRGVDDQPATQTDKVWWVQAEMLAALSDALAHQPNASYALALDQLLAFIVQYGADPKDGIWYDTVAADGTVKNPAKAHSWKANYHDVRAIVKFIKAFDPAQKGKTLEILK